VQMIRRVQVGRTDQGFCQRLALTMALLMFLSEPSAALSRLACSTQPSHQQPSASDPGRTEKDVSIDGGTLLLEYLLGEQRSVLWAVTSDSVKQYELPGRAVIEKAAQRVTELLTARLPRDNETNLDAFKRAARSRSQFTAAAVELSQMILGPVADDLGRKRLLIVADGALHFIPFAALPKPRTDDQMKSRMVGQRRAANRRDRPPAISDRQSPNPLILDHEIVNLPSASVLGMLQRRRQTRPVAKKLLALLADPVFERDDPRFNPELTGETAAQQSDIATLRSAVTVSTIPGMQGGLTRLRFARQEADHILAALSPAERETSLAAFDFTACQELALSTELGRYRYLHFATHGFLDNERPELSGVALSLLDRDGRDKDGFLRLVEIYNLRLAAELVTLSACETGLGKQVSGEGIVGLTHGFLHAGASRVLVSLWKVDDRASARLMGRVYEGIFREKLSPAAALRKAQLSLRQDPATSDPFFWAAFVLHGEPR
jgi:CHAT domain-containing protein